MKSVFISAILLFTLSARAEIHKSLIKQMERNNSFVECIESIPYAGTTVSIKTENGKNIATVHTTLSYATKKDMTSEVSGKIFSTGIEGFAEYRGPQMRLNIKLTDEDDTYLSGHGTLASKSFDPYMSEFVYVKCLIKK